MYDFAKEMHFVVRGIGNKTTPDRTPKKILKSPAIVASGFSKILFLSPDSDELCKSLKLLLQQKYAGKNSD